MYFLPLFLFLLLATVFGREWVPPDFVLWAVLFAIFLLGAYGFSHHNITDWHIALLIRLEEFVLVVYKVVYNFVLMVYKVVYNFVLMVYKVVYNFVLVVYKKVSQACFNRLINPIMSMGTNILVTIFIYYKNLYGRT